MVALRRGLYFLNPNGSVDDVFIVLDEDHNNRIDKGSINTDLPKCIRQRIRFEERIFLILRQMPTNEGLRGISEKHAL